jgi:hypothetical protein
MQSGWPRPNAAFVCLRGIGISCGKFTSLSKVLGVSGVAARRLLRLAPVVCSSKGRVGERVGRASFPAIKAINVGMTLIREAIVV